MKEWSQSEQGSLFFCNETQPGIQATCAIKAALSEASRGCTGEIFNYPIASIEPNFEPFNYHDCKYDEKEIKDKPFRLKEKNKYSFVVPYFSVSDAGQWLTGVYDALSSISSIEDTFFFEIIATNKRVQIQFATTENNLSVIEKAFRARFPASDFDCQNEDFLNECLQNLNTDALSVEALYPKLPYYRNLIAPISKNTSILNQLLSSLPVLEDNEFFYYRLAIEKAKSLWDKNCQSLFTYEHKILAFYSDANLIEDWHFSPYSESKKAITEKIHPQNAPFFFISPMIVFVGNKTKFSTIKSFISGFRFGDNPYNTLHKEDFISKLGKDDFIKSLRERTMHMQGHFVNRLELSCFVLFPCENCHEIKDHHFNTAVGKPIPLEFQKGILLGRNKHAAISTELRMPKELIENSLVTMGNMGYGKSNLLQNILVQLADENSPKYSIILFYFHDFDFVSDFVSRIPDHRLNDVILAMPSLKGKVLKKNIVDHKGIADISLKAADLSYAFETGSTGFGVDIKFVIKNLFQILLLADNVSLADIFDVVRCKSEKGKRIRKQARDRTDNPLLREYIDILNEKGEDEKKILNKFQQMFDTRSTALMSHYSGKDAIDYRDIVENNKILIWYLGGLNDAGDMVASVETSLIHHHFLSYANTTPKPYFPTVTVIDEVQRIKARGICESVREDRKHGLSNILSTQSSSGVDPNLIEAINLIPNQIVFQCTENDAKFFCQRAGGAITPKEIASFRKYEMIARLHSAQHVYSCTPDLFVKGDTSKIETVITNSLNKYYTEFPTDSDTDNISDRSEECSLLKNMPESIVKIVNRNNSTNKRS
jgi:hypothetical protein